MSDTPITREDQLYDNIVNGEAADLSPITRKETFLAAIANGEKNVGLDPITREERYLAQIAENGSGGGGGFELVHTTKTYKPGDTLTADDREGLEEFAGHPEKYLGICHFTSDEEKWQCPIYNIRIPGANAIKATGGAPSGQPTVQCTWAMNWTTNVIGNMTGKHIYSDNNTITPTDSFIEIFKYPSEA